MAEVLPKKKAILFLVCMFLFVSTFLLYVLFQFNSFNNGTRTKSVKLILLKSYLPEISTRGVIIIKRCKQGYKILFIGTCYNIIIFGTRIIF